ncbi:SusC/RagA family TonB-linked outer membrane protein [Segetibacter aerophilus]|uniref:SusC/RagA family TonB-linked outer membrane protein n=1 Tax=Segetibacter aerophilus TaxID=670293 RepID=A0A512BDV9_9BACT|nr:TonB-dependent receptor [Segetibacter aerophilus]GEO10151.1 SusC/RagA family TonB-linked outer membrane protein [Segetibacter aerophilus]
MKLKFSLSLILILLAGFAFAQQRISGRVNKANSNEGVPGVTVSVKGGKASSITDTAGHFTITVPNANATLVFTSVGFAKRELTLSGSTTANISLAEEPTTMNDVVVIGYQSVRRKDLLASVSSVGAKDLKDIPINNAAEALNGRLAGVTATTSEGSPDAAVRIRVRGGMSISSQPGANDPLYVIDGVQVENGLATISPQDIQTIDVLKDAAATAIYGARGANGVIVITTKSGRVGRTIVSYNGLVGVRKIARKLNVLDPYEFVLYQSERSRGSSTDSTSFARNFGTTWDTLTNYKNLAPVDWQDQVFGRTGMTQTHNLSAVGGTKAFTYSFGYTYNDDKAIVLNSSFKRHLLNFKGNYKITQNLSAGISTRYTLQNVFGAGVSSEAGSAYSRLRNAVRYRPFLSANQDLEDQDPLADPNAGNNLVLINPILLANSEYRKRTTDAYNVTLNASYNIAKNLTFRSTFGFDRNKVVDRQYFDTVSSYSTIQGGKKPIAGLDTTERKIYTNSNVLTYSIKGFKQNHNFDFLVGEETYDLRNVSQSSLFRNYPLFTAYDVAFKQTSLGVPFAGYPQLGETRYTSLSFFGRASYSYKDKYLFSANLRRDAASKFAPDQRWGSFPSGSIAWRVKKEKFLENVDFINEMKLRFGFGTIGNNRIQDYLYLTTFSNNGSRFYGINNQAVNGYYPVSLVNQNLKWESTVNRNYGVDLTLFKNRLDLSVDYYNNSSKDLLLAVQIDPTYGFTTQQQNIGKTSNKGVEVQLNATILRKTNGLNWSANFNIAHNKNTVVALGPGQEFFYPAASWGVSGQPTDYIVKIGEPVGAMYGLVTDGFYTVNDFNYNPATSVYTLKTGVVNNSGVIGGPTQPGSIKYKDLNNDGVIDLDRDRTIIGNPTPKFTGGLNQQFSYKAWDMSLFVNFSYGNDVYNANKIEFTNGYVNNSNLLDIMQNRWRTVTATGQTAQWVGGTSAAPIVYGIAPEQLSALNANATIWQPLRGTGAFYPHSWAIEDGSFLRINNLTVGYSFPATKVAKLHMSRLRFYLTANNLAVITNYTGFDPEVSVRNNPLTPNLDYSAYPKSRSFIFGINASF